MFLQILMAISFLIAGYQDLRERLVSDEVWIPASIGIVLLFYFDSSQALFLLVWIGIFGLIGFLSTRLGFLGDADGIALVMISAWFLRADYLALTASLLIGLFGFLIYLYLAGMLRKGRVITIQQFKSEAKWIPRAIIIGGKRTVINKDVNIAREEVEKVTEGSAEVEVDYGVPNIAMLAVVYVVYVALLAVFQSGTLLALP
ncbi:MAG: hypothetical protein ABSG45_10160 [Nitrososphaerales archaeon]